MRNFRQRYLAIAVLLCSLLIGQSSPAIEIVLDYTLDDNNEAWFSGSSEGLARRASLDSAAAFLSAILTNDDWNSLGSLNQNLSFSDIAASSLYDLDGNLISGTPESDGQGYAYSFSTTNRSSIAANEYIVYVGAFAFDAATSSLAKGGWSSNGSRRNDVTSEFNTWGGRIYFNTTKNWYAGLNPGADPTDDYGVQDPNKMPTTDISSDNWDWSTSSDTWKGFDLESVDPAANGKADLYGTGAHELMHALGATSSNLETYVGVDNTGDALTGANVVAEYGRPVPLSSSGGHFDFNVQSEVWDSDGIISEALLDPSSTTSDRKYLTKLDAALLRDLGYDVLSAFASTAADFDTDGDVDADDLLAWQTAYGSGGADADDDGDTDGSDFLVWQTQFDGGVETIANSTVVPEPATMLLISIAIAGCGLTRLSTGSQHSTENTCGGVTRFRSR